MERRLLMLLVTAVASPLWAQTVPTAYFSFEEDMNATGPAGAIVSAVQGAPALVPGQSGRGLQVGPQYGSLVCPTAGLFHPQAGTIEMWVRAVDWEPSEDKFHVFFDMRSDAGVLYLYKFFSSDRLLMLCGPAITGPLSNSSMPMALQPGEWHHIAGTWSPQGVMAYFDGQPAGAQPVLGELPTALAETFVLGDEPWQFARTSSSIIDEVRIYDRALTPAHIAAHAAGDLDFTLPLTAETAAMDYQIDPDAGTAEIRVSTGGADVDEERLQARLTILRPGAHTPEVIATPPFASGELRATVPVSLEQPGTHELVATISEAGRPAEAITLRRELIVPTTEWLGNQIGLEDVVLPPWTPVEVEGTNLRCWAREYQFADTMLPSQIIARDAPLLAEPVALKLSGEGGAVPLIGQSVRLVENTPTRARMEGRATAQIGGRETTFRSDLTFEYDGLLLVELTCDDPAQFGARGLTIDIPVRDEHALYLHRYVPQWQPTSGSMPAGEGVLDSTAFVPFAWFGDNDRGLFWFCESSEMWPNGQAENAIEVVREGDRVVLRLNVMGADQALPENWRLVFGLQATPVKPIPRSVRNWRMTGALQGDRVRARQNIEIVWPNPTAEDSLAMFGWPEARNEQAFRERIDGMHERGLMAVPYLCLTWVTDDTPEWRFFHLDWEGKSYDSSIPAAGWPHQFALVSPVGEGYSDFIIWKTKQFMEQYQIDGTYHDQTHPYTSTNLRAGWGWERDGKRYVTYPILGYRALYRRNYAMVKSLPWPTFTQAHMSGKMVVPVLAYDDTYLDGEHFRGIVKDSYMDVTTLDAFRAEYMGRQWGLAPVFLPEFDEEHRPLVEPTRGLMALLMIHDINVWPIWCNAQVVDDAFVALDEFGYADAEFIPYFDPRPPASTDLADVHVSAYQKADGSALLIVANLSKENRSGEIAIDLDRLGLTGAQAVSWPDQGALAMDDGAVSLEIPRLGYRMVRLSR